MDEEEFDSRLQWNTFTTKDAAHADARLRRCATLAFALWGTTVEGVTRQLLAPTPQIPPGFDLADFRDLQRTLEKQSMFAARYCRSTFSPFISLTISVGAQRFTLHEACCEIVRRAIEYLESL